MLKWTKTSDSKAMSETHATSADGGTLATSAASSGRVKKALSQNGVASNSSTLVYPAGVSDDVNMNEVNGPVSLDVLLPNGHRTEIIVDYNTPMLDLLVCLAGKSKLNPAGLALVLVSGDTGRAMSYKPNQTIGSLGGRLVHIVNKDVMLAKSIHRDGRKEKPFEVTHRFTVNLPRGQKIVVRVSPAMTLADLVMSVCRDKGLDLDLHRYVLQIPGKPGMPVDLNSTVQEAGVYEMNLVTDAVQTRSHTISMPDLSRTFPVGDQSVSYSKDQKKKKGLLSFLGKKDRRNKQDGQTGQENNSTSNLIASQDHRPTTNPSTERNVSVHNQQTVRPKSMFVSSDTKIDHNSFGHSPQPVAAPARKKRRAPAPPAPSMPPALSESPALSVPLALSESPSSLKQARPFSEMNVPFEQGSKDNASAGQTVHNTAVTTNREIVIASLQPVSRVEMLSHLHSRNSSDSSGYHELTLSGCESPDAAHAGVSKHKTSIDTTSIESSDNVTGDSGVLGSPTRVSPIEELQEKAETNAAMIAKSSYLSSVADSRDTVTLKKKRKAPAPPGPSSVSTPASTSVSTPASASVSTAASTSVSTPGSASVSSLASTSVSTPASTSVSTPALQAVTTRTITLTEPVVASCATVAVPAMKDPVPSVQVSSGVTQVTGPSLEASTSSHEIPAGISDISPEQLELPESDTGYKISTEVRTEKTYPNLNTNTTEMDESTAFDINDILEGVVFDEVPQSMELTFAQRSETQQWDQDGVMMMETASVNSENIEQLDISSGSGHSHSSIPLLSQPSPKEQQRMEMKSVTSDTGSLTAVKGTGNLTAVKGTGNLTAVKGTGNLTAVKGTVINDNASLTPFTAESSPDTAHNRKNSHSSLASVDTIESISLDFQQAIQLGEETVSFPVDDVEGSSGYKNEMALFVERMSKMAMEKSATRQDSETVDDSISCLSVPGSDNSDTGSVIRHLDSGSEAGSLTRKEGQKMMAADLHTPVSEFSDDIKKSLESFAMSEEITEPFETLPPPPEFDDVSDIEGDDETIEEFIIPLGPNGHNFSGTKKTSKLSPNHIKKESSPQQIEEASDSQQIEQASSPQHIEETSDPQHIGETSVSKQTGKASGLKQTGKATKENGSKGNTDLLKEETPMLVTPSSKLIFQSHPRQSEMDAQPPQSKKEMFVLTNEDLSNVNVLPPKPKMAKPYVETQPYVQVSFTSLVMAKSSHSETSTAKNTNISSSDNVQTKDFQICTTSGIAPKQVFQSDVPKIKPNAHTNHMPVVPDDTDLDFCSDPLLSKSRPRLVMNSSSNSSRRSNTAGNVQAVDSQKSETGNISSNSGSGFNSAVHKAEPEGSQASTQITRDHQLDIKGQYQSIQSQISQWQEQLTKNQDLLASQIIDNQAKHQQQETKHQQLTAQQKHQEAKHQQQTAQQKHQETKHQQLTAQQKHQETKHQQQTAQQKHQETKHQQLTAQQKHQETKHQLLTVQQKQQKTKHQQLIVQQKQQMPSTGKEHSSQSGELGHRAQQPVTKTSSELPASEQKSAVVKSKSSADKQRPKFEREVTPREQLMLAIRNFSKEDLNSVPVQKTNWIASSR